tara:strand:+ start:261 stop:461 length:201 start_codon:yes stop_codon:yes gene_type:complete
MAIPNKLYELKILYMTLYKGTLTEISYYGMSDEIKQKLQDQREILKTLDIDYKDVEDQYYKLNPKI